MGTRVVYVGPHAEGVEVVDAGLWAMPGEEIEVDNDLAARLLEQPTWARPAQAAKVLAEGGQEGEQS